MEKNRKNNWELLKYSLNILQNMRITAWLDQGSLLGIIREGRFLPWDSDIDLGIWDKDIRGREDEFFNEMSSKGRVTVRQNFIFIHSQSKGLYKSISIARYHRCGEKAVKYMQKFYNSKILKALIVPIGGWVTKEPGFKLCAVSKNLGSNNISHNRKILNMTGKFLLFMRSKILDLLSKDIRNEVDASFFDNLKPIKIMDIEVHIPVESEKYLELKYGKEWKIPDKNWIWWEQDGGLV